MSHRRAFLLLVTVFLISTLSFRSVAGDKAMLGTHQMIYLEVNKKNCDVELYVNGIPMRYSSNNQAMASIPVHQYLIDGKNEIEFIVNPGPTPSKARTAQRELDSTDMQASARLVKYPVGAYPGDASGEVLGTLQWTGQNEKKEMFPKMMQRQLSWGRCLVDGSGKTLK